MLQLFVFKRPTVRQGHDEGRLLTRDAKIHALQVFCALSSRSSRGAAGPNEALKSFNEGLNEALITVLP